MLPLADSPHTSNDDKLNRKPFCKDGSTCFYFAPMPGLDNGDIYAANTGGLRTTAGASADYGGSLTSVESCRQSCALTLLHTKSMPSCSQGAGWGMGYQKRLLSA